jgi:hypothetical protein
LQRKAKIGCVLQTFTFVLFVRNFLQGYEIQRKVAKTQISGRGRLPHLPIIFISLSPFDSGVLYASAFIIFGCGPAAK